MSRKIRRHFTDSGDYCLAVKGNQGTLHEDIDLYFSDAKLLSKLTEKGCHYQTIEKARSQIEVRDYWVSHDVKWLSQRHPKWQKLRGIGMTKNTIDKDGIITEEVRYFILSFKCDVQKYSVVCDGNSTSPLGMSSFVRDEDKPYEWRSN